MVAITHISDIPREGAGLFLGVDPGKKGALAIVDEDGNIISKVMKHPTAIETYSWLRMAIEKHRVLMAAIEKPFAKSMNKGVFTYLSEYGELRMALKLANIPFVEVHPSKWTKKMHKILPQGREGFKSAKEASLASARKIWPDECWKATERSRTPSDGLVDAALIAEWCRRTHGSKCTSTNCERYEEVS